MKNIPLFVAIVISSGLLCTSATHNPDFSSVMNENITAFHLLATPTAHFFQLQVESNGMCLKLTKTKGVYVPCTNHESTIYFLNGDKTNNYNIVILGTKYCLDREHCHKSSSNLRYSSCDHCGATHWDIRSDGSVREDSGKNCIYSKSSSQAAVRHCKDGFESFNILPLGDRFLVKSVKHGDCVSGGQFINCDCAPTYYVTGTPRDYSIRLYIPGDTCGNICLDREHCHSSTSNLRFSECKHCGAIHWSIEGTKIGEDGMKNCINRKDGTVAYMKHCKDSHEELYYEIIPQPQSTALQVKESELVRFFPDPNINHYLHLNLAQGCRGVKIFRYSQDGTVEVEVVHFLPTTQQFYRWPYYVQYIVTHIHTNIRYDSSYGSEYILERLETDPSRVTAINIRYGGIGGPNRNNYDGLISEFFTNSGGVPIPQGNYQRIVSEIYDGFRHATNNWNGYYDSWYRGRFSPQVFLSISYGYYVALYWSYYGCNRQFHTSQNSEIFLADFWK